MTTLHLSNRLPALIVSLCSFISFLYCTRDSSEINRNKLLLSIKSTYITLIRGRVLFLEISEQRIVLWLI